jgi:NTP pyrophosphatase (non-canonical NTP hydrolase)
MRMNDYQHKAMGTLLDTANNVPYMLLNLSSEVGELHSLFAKHQRDGGDLDWNLVKKELGDVLWQVAGCAYVFGYSLEDIAQQNLDKLAARKIKGTLKGSGNERE